MSTQPARHARIEIVPVERETYVDENGDEWEQGLPTYFLRLRASNGATLAHSETYASRSNARRAAESLLRAMHDLVEQEKDTHWADSIVREVQA